MTVPCFGFSGLCEADQGMGLTSAFLRRGGLRDCEATPNVRTPHCGLSGEHGRRCASHAL